jgi:septation ring formation regulator EzrA
MARTLADQIQDLNAALAEMSTNVKVLTARVADQEKQIERGARRDEEFIAKSVAADERIVQLRGEVTTLREDLRRALDRLAASEAKNAALDERSRHLEKTGDRGWQLWLAVLGFGFGLVSLLVTAALQFKK